MLAFVHIEKCGGTTLIDILRRNFVLDHCDLIPRDKRTMLLCPADLRAAQRLRPSLKSLAGHSLRLACGLDADFPGLRYYTCLRDPVKRFLSEYHYFVEHFGCRLDFKKWLDSGDRSNFQTRAIAGRDDLDDARHALETRFAAVGLLERFDEFLVTLRELAREDLGVDLDVRYQIQNTREGRRARPADGPNLLAEHGDAIRAANATDIALYEHARNVIMPRQRARLAAAGCDLDASLSASATLWSKCTDAGRRAAYLAFRNLVYKPSMGYWPGAHWLPEYRDMVKAA